MLYEVDYSASAHDLDCGFVFTDTDKAVPVSAYSREQYKRCLNCKFRECWYAGNICRKGPDGVKCLLGQKDHSEPKE